MNNELIKLNCLLAKLTKSHQYPKALQLFHQIQSSQHLKPDQYTLSTILTATANLRDLISGTQLHSHIIRTGFKTFPHVANTLLFLYSKSEDLPSVKRVFNEIKLPDVYSWTTLLSACTNLGEVDYARQLLDEIPQRNEAVWNAVITGCVDNGYSDIDIALGLFNRMHLLGIRHDNYSLASVLSLCCCPELFDFGRQVHLIVIKTGFLARVSVTNALITMYFNFGDVNQAYKVFNETEESDQITFNAMISGLVNTGRDDRAFEMFKKMQKDGFDPTERTFVSLMGSCYCELAALQVHACTIKTGFNDFSSVGNAVITMYSNYGDLKSAQMVFWTLKEKDRVSWNTMITSYAQENMCKDAILAYLHMQEQGYKPDEFTIGSLLSTMDSLIHVNVILATVMINGLISKTEVANALISTLSKLNAIDEACSIFTETKFKNLISWNSMISGFHLNGWSVDGLCLFYDMLGSGLTPDVYTLSIVLNICASVSDFRHGKEMHGYILKFNYHHETCLGNALIALYAKCGVLDWSVKVFESMVDKDVVSWNSMISGYAQHGRGEDAVSCFGSMQKSTVEPDNTTFTAALTACSHAGLVDTGVEIFNSMVNEYGVEPTVDHFSCLVDLVGRAGYLDAAEMLIKRGGLKVHSSVWWNLFSGCAAHGDLRLGRIVAGFLLEAEEDKAGVYVVLANILADGGHWEEAEDVRKMMRGYGAVKQPGYSWIRS